ncbi:hypothetical protein BC937DRAFT_95313 [Endogone sp. FLAS-F59071]|nr:hypothetical protein BC937DRAFT_95313 [Endogone sp. FLAS-F59071]|eukprot:RUS20389.1 hypothetical protein BC937DRAFT_95313 [Endogone sp. FLAS-F59071]
MNNSTRTIPNLQLTDGEQAVFNSINFYANIPSIFLALLVEVLIVTLALYDRKFVNRVSLRLAALISATDIVNACALLIYTEASSDGENGPSCKISAFLIVWLTNQYLFLTVCIAFNLQYLFLQEKGYNAYIEKYYYVLSIGLSFLTGFIPLMFSRYDYDAAQGFCWYTPSYTFTSQAWEYSTFLIPIIISIAYCSIVISLVVYKIHNGNKLLDSSLKHTCTIRGSLTVVEIQRRKIRRIINCVIYRIILYVMIPMATQLGFIVSEIWMYTYMRASYPLNLWSVVTSALPGTLNFFAFILDPAIHKAIETIRSDLIQKYGGKVSCMSKADTSSSTGLTSNHPANTKGFARWFVRTFIGTTRQNDGLTFCRVNELRISVALVQRERSNYDDFSTVIVSPDAKDEPPYPHPPYQELYELPRISSEFTEENGSWEMSTPGQKESLTEYIAAL